LVKTRFAKQEDRFEIFASEGPEVDYASPQSVDYAHRTTAEYLAAAWLADSIRKGLPVGRVLALMGADGHPAPELNAWLAVHLPEFADQLIDADPYGVLTYGDAASLSRSSCARLEPADLPVQSPRKLNWLSISRPRKLSA
jgi:hypothetical protein